MTDGRLVIALDVDGVLNPLGNPTKLNRRGFVKHRDIPVDGHLFDLWLHPGHGEMLATLAHCLDAELMWATTWNEHANAQIAPRIGLPTLPVIEVTPPFRLKPGPHWKQRQVLEAVGDRPLVWIDDQFTPEDHRWSSVRSSSVAATLLLRTDENVGLLEAHVEYVQRWWDRDLGVHDVVG